jgi:hypothetical protein
VGDVVAVPMKEHIRENAFLTDLRVEEVHIDNVTLCDAVLATACLDNCKCHGCSSEKEAKASMAELL